MYHQTIKLQTIPSLFCQYQNNTCKKKWKKIMCLAYDLLPPFSQKLWTTKSPLHTPVIAALEFVRNGLLLGYKQHSKAVSFVFSTLFFLIIIIPKNKLIRRMRSRAEKCSYYNDQWREGLHETQQWAFMAEKLRTRPALLSSTPRHCTVKPTKLFSICTLFFPCFILSILSLVNYELVNSQN